MTNNTPFEVGQTVTFRDEDLYYARGHCIPTTFQIACIDDDLVLPEGTNETNRLINWTGAWRLKPMGGPW